ncbi:MAG: PPOX class F420-dependent oxidoreductase [Ktedonobacterales bacterium]
MELELGDEVRQFVEQPHYAILATIGSDGMPQQTVLWYELQGDEIMMNTAAGRVKDRNLRRDPRASVCVTADGMAVTFTGTVTLNDEQDRALADIHRLAVRYDGPEAAERVTRDQFSKQHRVTVRLKIEKVVPQGF